MIFILSVYHVTTSKHTFSQLEVGSRSQNKQQPKILVLVDCNTVSIHMSHQEECDLPL